MHKLSLIYEIQNSNQLLETVDINITVCIHKLLEELIENSRMYSEWLEIPACPLISQ